MSNEYKDWLWDKVQDVLFEAGVVDKTFNTSTTRFVDGLKNGERVRFEVWYDDQDCEWKFERRELNI